MNPPDPLPRGTLVTRTSPLHGKGVFAARAILNDTRIIEYRGERITMKEAQRRYPVDPVPYHTFLFELEDGHTLDAARTRCQAKWINHSCDPNCEPHEEAGRIWIDAIRDIAPDEELTYDYGFVLEVAHTAAMKKRFPCWCGSPHCRGTMLARKG